MVSVRVGDDDVSHILTAEPGLCKRGIHLLVGPVEPGIHQRRGVADAQQQHVENVVNRSVGIKTLDLGLLLFRGRKQNGRIQILLHKGNDPDVHLSHNTFMKRNVSCLRRTCR